MKQGIFTVAENGRIARDVYKMRLLGDTEAITKPGQFINIKLDGFYLRRPISVCDYDEDSVTIIYKTVGRGTEAMSGLQPGAQLDILSGLGNGFDISKAGAAPLLIGGGVGLPPMYNLAKKLLEKGSAPTVVMGFNTKEEIFLKEAFQSLGINTLVTTADGSLGIKGFVTDGIRTLAGNTYYYACGPLPMLKAVYDALPIPGEMSFEERMGCGFGACMGCSCKTKYGNKRICKDGPILKKEEIIW